MGHSFRGIRWARVASCGGRGSGNLQGVLFQHEQELFYQPSRYVTEASFPDGRPPHIAVGRQEGYRDASGRSGSGLGSHLVVVVVRKFARGFFPTAAGNYFRIVSGLCEGAFSHFSQGANHNILRSGRRAGYRDASGARRFRQVIPTWSSISYSFVVSMRRSSAAARGRARCGFALSPLRRVAVSRDRPRDKDAKRPASSRKAPGGAVRGASDSQ